MRSSGLLAVPGVIWIYLTPVMPSETAVAVEVHAYRRIGLHLDVGLDLVRIALVELDAGDLTHLDPVELDLSADAQAADRTDQVDAIIVEFLIELKVGQPHGKDERAKQQGDEDHPDNHIICLAFHQ